MYKKIRTVLIALGVVVTPLFARADNFSDASAMLAAARAGDTTRIAQLIGNGANINFVDNTGMSVVCTAMLNNDTAAVRILTNYGADASKCDQQIRQYRNNSGAAAAESGLLSGLSTPQSMTLGVGAAAAAAGAVFLIANADGSGGGNGNGSGGTGGRPCTGTGCDNGGGGDNGGATTAATLPVGPAQKYNSEYDFAAAQNFYATDTANGLDYALMTNSYTQNYLLMMRGYAPLARGYMGMRTMRTNGHDPLNLSGFQLNPSDQVMGGRPITVALVTSNGINAAADTSLADRKMLYTTCKNGFANCTVAADPSNATMTSNKYWNNEIVLGADNTTTADDSFSEKSGFDFSGNGTAINNTDASSYDDLLAKVVIGDNYGRAAADFVGFMPNGQLAVFRTGGGTTGAMVGTMTDVNTNNVWDTGDTIVVGGDTYTITRNADGTFSVAGANNYTGTIDSRGYMHVDGGNIYSIKKNGDIYQAQDFMNYQAMINAAAQLTIAKNNDASITAWGIVANASANPFLRAADSKTIDDVLSATTDKSVRFAELVNDYYDVDGDDSVGAASVAFFNGLGSTYKPLTIFGTGAYVSDAAYQDKVQFASFENAAPIVFNNLEHLFMSVVAVSLSGTGTNGAGDDVAGFANNSNKLQLSTWTDAESGAALRSRACGIAGAGTSSIDPWCFAAAGVTDELAVSAMAGAAGAAMGAFNYMSNDQIFYLLALTADGRANTAAQLRELYVLPGEYQTRYDNNPTDENYMKLFAEVYGYGLVNLDRATTPGSKLWFYTAGKLNPNGGKNAYWTARSASIGSGAWARSALNLSAAFGGSNAVLSANAYDMVESADGTMQMPRVFEHSFALNSGARGSYDLMRNFGAADETVISENDLTLRMSVRDLGYDDGYGNIGKLSAEYDAGALRLSAGYDGDLGAANIIGNSENPYLSLANNAISAGAKYNTGALKFGARGTIGKMTEQGLLDSDPAMADMFMPAMLGTLSAAEINAEYVSGKFAFGASAGVAHENNTTLGAYTDGMFDMGGGKTQYAGATVSYAPHDDIKISARATFGKTTASPDGALIANITDMYSDAFDINAEFGRWSFGIARPLAVRSGMLTYAATDYEIVDGENGYDLIANPEIRELNLAAANRETRLSAAYRAPLGDFTTAALGLSYRINPDNTTASGDEAILMMHIRHSW